MLFNGFNVPSEQDVFDKLYYYYKIANNLLDESVELAKDDKNCVLHRSKELRKKFVVNAMK
jgi:hypothetical protein